MKRRSSRPLKTLSLVLFCAFASTAAWSQSEGRSLPEGAVIDRESPSTYYAPVDENSYGCTFYVKRSMEDDVVTDNAIYFRTDTGEFSMDGAVCREQIGMEVE